MNDKLITAQLAILLKLGVIEDEISNFKRISKKKDLKENKNTGNQMDEIFSILSHNYLAMGSCISQVVAKWGINA